MIGLLLAAFLVTQPSGQDRIITVGPTFGLPTLIGMKCAVYSLKKDMGFQNEVGIFYPLGKTDTEKLGFLQRMDVTTSLKKIGDCVFYPFIGYTFFIGPNDKSQLLQADMGIDFGLGVKNYDFGGIEIGMVVPLGEETTIPRVILNFYYSTSF